MLTEVLVYGGLAGLAIPVGTTTPNNQAQTKKLTQTERSSHQMLPEKQFKLND
jgi:hypothetical protein